jgi:hypothetical protein
MPIGRAIDDGAQSLWHRRRQIPGQTDDLVVEPTRGSRHIGLIQRRHTRQQLMQQQQAHGQHIAITRGTLLAHG